MKDKPELRAFKGIFTGVLLGIILWIIVIGIVLLLISCSTIQSRLTDADFQKDNLPIRTIQVAILDAKDRPIEEAKTLIKETSDSFEQQVGIRFEIVKTYQMRMESNNYYYVLSEMRKWLKPNEKEFDIGISVLPYTVGQFLGIAPYGGADLNRYAVVYTLNKQYLIHELIHVITKSDEHDGGVMFFGCVMVIPGVCIPPSEYMTETTRDKVLKNKWRKF